MSMTLVEALQQVNLESGRTYRCQVNDRWVEVRVLDEPPPAPSMDIPESDIMLDAWTDLPRPPMVGTSISQLIEPPLPPPLDLSADQDNP